MINLQIYLKKTITEISWLVISENFILLNCQNQNMIASGGDVIRARDVCELCELSPQLWHSSTAVVLILHHNNTTATTPATTLGRVMRSTDLTTECCSPASTSSSREHQFGVIFHSESTTETRVCDYSWIFQVTIR